jgi:hypothetical protein
MDHSVVDTIFLRLWIRTPSPGRCSLGSGQIQADERGPFLSIVTALTLQRVRELQEEAAVSDHLVTSLQPTGNLRLPVQAFSKRD